ncbi:integrase arm-type DNA-binding domain-containing protein [Pseudoxanthobacter sp. M-2]|uniref:tyrosine-type recombinase/integrase n=1 Tax=Pseudoxanthobacter sp. M-2 TaxID=3078754 RepID=UPI0038FCF0E2
MAVAARTAKRLNTRTLATLTKPGLYADGDGLNLQIGKTGSRSWIYRYRRGDGREGWLGLGSLSDVTLAQAREKAAHARQLRAAGFDPLDEKRAPVASQGDAAPAKPTFGDFADAYIAEIAPGFSNPKHRAQWKMTLGDGYCATIRGKPIDEVDTDDLLAILRPIWLTKSETASRIRGRIEQVLSAAKARGLRSGDNPALWRGHLDVLLPRRPKLARGHHKAKPYADVPALMERLARLTGISTLALRFTILTAARSGEVLGATWGEIDLEVGVWTVPAERMKMRREHRVPLSPAALAILAEVAPLRPADDDGSAFVFPGQKRGRPLSVMSLTMVMRRLNADATVHGFRSAFRDWCAEETNHPREVAEQALAHVVGDATERAYRRGDALAKRRALMQDWAGFCLGGLG